MCVNWGEVELFVEKYHLNTMSTNWAVHIFNDNAMMLIRKIVQRKQKQLTLDTFMAKKARKATAEEEESTASKRQRMEKTPKGELPSIFHEETPKKAMETNKVQNYLIIMHYCYVLLFFKCILY